MTEGTVHTHDDDGSFHVQPTREGDGPLIVHVKPVKTQTLGMPALIDDVPSGRDLERRERDLRKAQDAGYEVTDVPDDGQQHPYGRPCPICNA